MFIHQSNSLTKPSNQFINRFYYILQRVTLLLLMKVVTYVHTFEALVIFLLYQKTAYHGVIDWIEITVYYSRGSEVGYE